MSMVTRLAGRVFKIFWFPEKKIDLFKRPGNSFDTLIAMLQSRSPSLFS